MLCEAPTVMLQAILGGAVLTSAFVIQLRRAAGQAGS